MLRRSSSRAQHAAALCRVRDATKTAPERNKRKLCTASQWWLSVPSQMNEDRNSLAIGNKVQHRNCTLPGGREKQKTASNSIKTYESHLLVAIRIPLHHSKTVEVMTERKKVQRRRRIGQGTVITTPSEEMHTTKRTTSERRQDCVVIEAQQDWRMIDAVLPLEIRHYTETALCQVGITGK